MINLSRINKLIVFCLFLLLLTGCSVGEVLQTMDDSLGTVLKNSDDSENKVENKSNDLETKENTDLNELTNIQKEKIDEWLEKNGYNRYGDPGGIMYTGGTPLFNEQTGETIDRFEYILKKHPDILNLIK